MVSPRVSPLNIQVSTLRDPLRLEENSGGWLAVAELEAVLLKGGWTTQKWFVMNEMAFKCIYQNHCLSLLFINYVSCIIIHHYLSLCIYGLRSDDLCEEHMVCWIVAWFVWLSSPKHQSRHYSNAKNFTLFWVLVFKAPQGQKELVYGCLWHGSSVCRDGKHAGDWDVTMVTKPCNSEFGHGHQLFWFLPHRWKDCLIMFNPVR